MDTNCLIAILSRKGNYFPVWQGLHQGKYILCVSNDIIEDFHFHLIEQDKDDNKFVDCAIAANAQFIVSEDSHFKHLKNIPFPTVNVIRLGEFMNMLMLGTNL